MARPYTARLVELGLPAPKPRQSLRTYFRSVSESNEEGWIQKAMEFNGQSESQILFALGTKRKPKPKKAPPKTNEQAENHIPLEELIEGLTTAGEACDFVRSSPTISRQFLNYVLKHRKDAKKTRK